MGKTSFIETLPPADHKPQKRKRRQFVQKWRDDPELKDWITEPQNPEFNSSAHCVICRIDIRGGSTHIKRHATHKKHIDNAVSQGLQWLLIKQPNSPTGRRLKYEGHDEDKDSPEPEEEHEQYSDIDEDYYPVEVQESPPRSSKKYFKWKEYEYNKKRKFRNRAKSSSADYEFSSPPKIIYKEIYKEKTENEDHITIFGKYIGEELRRLDDFHTIQTVKCNINNVLYEATVGKYSKKNQSTGNSHEVHLAHAIFENNMEKDEEQDCSPTISMPSVE